MSGATLLDANVLIALVVGDHVHHEAAVTWFASDPRTFATCPITQGSLVRLLVRQGEPASSAVAAVAKIGSNARHEFWRDDLDLTHIDAQTVAGHGHVTDAYLAALARHRGGQLATFDRDLAIRHSDVAFLVPHATHA